jgi:HSP20 family protein
MSPRNPSDWMWAQAVEMVDEAERLHRQFFRLTVSQRPQAVWAPPVDVFEDESEVVIVVALPGVPPDRVEVTMEGGELVVHAECAFPFAQSHHVVRRLEIPYGHFERRIPLAVAGLGAGTRESANGCLVLRFSKAVKTGKS